MTDAERAELVQAGAAIDYLKAEQANSVVVREQVLRTLSSLTSGQREIRADIKCLSDGMIVYRPYLEATRNAQKQRAEYWSAASTKLVEMSVMSLYSAVVGAIVWAAYTLYHQAQADTREGIIAPLQLPPAITQPYEREASGSLPHDRQGARR